MVPSDVGVISTVYLLPLTATKLDKVPFVTVISPITNSFTVSLNCIVACSRDAFVGLASANTILVT